MATQVPIVLNTVHVDKTIHGTYYQNANKVSMKQLSYFRNSAASGGILEISIQLASNNRHTLAYVRVIFGAANYDVPCRVFWHSGFMFTQQN